MFTLPRRAAAVGPGLALLTLLTLVPLLIWDAAPRSFPERAHDVLASVPLALIGLACLAHSMLRGSRLPELAKSGALGAAFLFWAANQLWPDHPRAVLFNDVAVTLFVIDVFLSVVGWPSPEPEPRR